MAAFMAAATALLSAAPQRATFMPVSDIRAGMTGIGRTIYAGDTLENFSVDILGTIDGALGPGRTLILARLSGGPLADTGVIAGMSGSPVFIDGRLIGAVSYALGAFPKAPIAGITPIADMLADLDRPATAPGRGVALPWPATPETVFAALARRLGTTAGPAVPAVTIDAGVLRPIGAAWTWRGWDAAVAAPLRAAIGGAPQAPPPPRAAATGPLRPGDAIGASLMRGDFETGATGTITWIDGARVYAFGHPYLGGGPVRMPMTRARVITVLPSLQNSMKVAALGEPIGTFSEDRFAGMGGTVGVTAPELDVELAVHTGAAPDRPFRFRVLHDPTLTPLFAYVAILNTLTSTHRQAGPLSIGLTGTIDFGAAGRLTIDDRFTGEQAFPGVANAVLGPISAMMTNDWASTPPARMTLDVDVREAQDGLTIERAWLDTARPRYGATHTLIVQLRRYRGRLETTTLPLTMPASGPAKLTLLVADAPSTAALEARDLDPDIAHSVPELMAGLSRTRRNNRLYVRLLAPGAGSVSAGRGQPGLPESTRGLLDADPSSPTTFVPRVLAGAWESRFDAVVRGAREIPLALTLPIK